MHQTLICPTRGPSSLDFTDTAPSHEKLLQEKFQARLTLLRSLKVLNTKIEVLSYRVK
jgi:hypothetical protein